MDVETKDELASTWLPHLKKMPCYQPGHYIAHLVHLPAKSPIYVPFSPLIPHVVQQALEHHHITHLYRHQHEAITASLATPPCSVMLATATASGKSLAFIIPTLTTLLTHPEATALYLFTTKALAQDQLQALRAFLTSPSLAPLNIRCDTLVRPSKV